MEKNSNQYRKLYLDDVRNPKTEGWTVIRDYDSFINNITILGIPDEISFDHDLGDDVDKKEMKSGYDCAKWLCQYCWENGLPLPVWNVHSANPVGRDNIIQLLSNYEKKYNAVR